MFEFWMYWFHFSWFFSSLLLTMFIMQFIITLWYISALTYKIKNYTVPSMLYDHVQYYPTGWHMDHIIWKCPQGTVPDCPFNVEKYLNNIEAETRWPPIRRWHFQTNFLNENVKISIKISPKFVSKGPINDIQALVQIMAWRRPGDKPLFEPMVVRIPTHISVVRPQWNIYSIDIISGIYTGDYLYKNT